MLIYILLYTQYSVGSQVKSPSLGSKYFLICTTAGTSGNTEPNYVNVNIGDFVTDNTVKWKVDGMLPLSGGVTTSLIKGNPITLTADDGNGNIKSFVANANGTLTWNGTNIALTASPAFTGTPTAPTPNNGDSSNKIATTSYVKSCVPKSTGNSTTPVYVDSNGTITTGDKYVSASVLGTVLTEANNNAYSIEGIEHEIELAVDEGTWVVTAHAKFTGVQAGKRYGIELSKSMARVSVDDETCIIVHSSGTGAISLVTTGIFTMKSTDADGINLNAYASAAATIDSCRIRAVRIK